MNAKWNVVKSVKIVDGDGRWVASACKQGWTTEQQVHANAVLIAAAPDLLAALLQCESFMWTHQDYVNGNSVAAKALQDASAAIAKAEGKQ